MNIFIHFLITLVLCAHFKADTNTFAIAMVFGVLIDLDHLPRYIRHAIMKKKLFFTGIYMRTFLHEPIFLLIVVPISMLIKTPIPLYAYIAHIATDYLTTQNNRPLTPFSGFEFNGPFHFGTIYYWIFFAIATVFTFAYFMAQNRYMYILMILNQAVA